MKMIMILILFCSVSFAEVINVNGLKVGDLIEWKGVISSRAAPAQLYLYSPYRRRRHFSVMKMEIRGVRRSLAFSAGVSGLETTTSFYPSNGVCNMGSAKVAPNMAFRAIIRVFRDRLSVYWNKKLTFTFSLTHQNQNISRIFQIRVLGSAETGILRVLSDEDLAKELQEPNCGQVRRKLKTPEFCPQRRPTFRIVGGVTAFPGHHPWQAALRRKVPTGGETGHICGATLINKCWAVTAAHCFASVGTSSIRRLIVRVGDYYNRDNTNNSRDPRVEDSQDLEIEKVIRYEGYRSYPAPRHDVALIKLRNCATYSDFVQPACLPKSKSQFTGRNSVCSVSGWGASQDGQNANDYPACLKTNFARIRRNKICNASYGQDKFHKESMLCAVGLNHGDTCSGDSGGPLICFNCSQDTNFTLWGITSWGIGCGIKQKPGVYTRLSSYIRWIYTTTMLSPYDDVASTVIFQRIKQYNGFCFNDNMSRVN